MATTTVIREANSLTCESGSTFDVAGTFKVGGTAMTKTAAQLNAVVIGVAGSYKLARAEGTLDGSNPTSVASGLTTIISATATLKGTSAPGLGTCCLTCNINGTSVDVYAWKPTAADDCTLIASTGTESFYINMIGT